MKFDRQYLLTYVVFVLLGATGSTGYWAFFSSIQPTPIYLTPAPATAVPTLTPTPSAIVVFVNGAVVFPNTYELPFNSRVDEAIAAAGGFTEAAYVDVVNQAQLLQDGSQVYVPSVAETAVSTPTVVTIPLSNQMAPAGDGEAGEVAGQPININTAGSEALQTLPGIGPSTAQKIIDHRQESGPFTAIENIMDVSGIGEGKFDKIKDQITVEDGS